MSSMASGLKLDWFTMRPNAVSTGLIGDKWVMKNVADTPKKITAAKSTARLATNQK